MWYRILHRPFPAAPILLDGLSKLEYRGYDSAGLAVRDGENKTKIVKAKGRLKALAEKPTMAMPWLVPVVSVIPVGLPTGNLLRQMLILILPMMEMWSVFTMVLLRITRN